MELERNTRRGRTWQRDGEKKDFRKIGVEAREIEREGERKM